jgi:hypothetical protein
MMFALSAFGALAVPDTAVEVFRAVDRTKDRRRYALPRGFRVGCDFSEWISFWFAHNATPKNVDEGKAARLARKD